MEMGAFLFLPQSVPAPQNHCHLHLREAAKIMGFSDTEVFKKKYIEIEKKMKEGKFREYRYNNAFETVPVICQYVKSEELGIRN